MPPLHALRRAPCASAAAFVLLAALPLVAGARDSLAIVPLTMKCRGDSGEWRVDAGLDNALLARGKAEEIYRGRWTPVPQSSGSSYVWRGNARNKPGMPLVLFADRARCDGVSDPAYEQRLLASFAEGTAAAGCCRATFGYDLRAAPVANLKTKVAEDWTRQFVSLQPAIRACVLDRRLATTKVLKAMPMNQGNALVRVVGQDGATTDCIADIGSARVRDLRPVVWSDPPLPGAGFPTFYPAREQPPVLACGKVERVVTPDGVLAGYLQYGGCD
jgi:hypothetical protein